LGHRCSYYYEWNASGRCKRFNQDISAWDVSQVGNFEQFMTGKTFSDYDAANLDAIYNAWSITAKWVAVQVLQ
jgi:hypothetical protein